MSRYDPGGFKGSWRRAHKNAMKKIEREKLEHHIREKIEILKKDIISFKELTAPIPPDNSIGRLTRMEAISSKSINEATFAQYSIYLVKTGTCFENDRCPGFWIMRAV